MNLAKVYSAQFDILNSFIVEVEVDINKSGMPNYKIVGLGDKAVEESKERVPTAIKNTGFKESRKFRVTTSLSPADKKKEGPLFDLPMALGFLLANEEIIFNTEKKIFFGELSLNGDLKKVTGVLPMVKIAKEKGFKSIYLPEENKEEAALIEGINIFPAKNLKEVIEHLIQEDSDEKKLEKIIKPFIAKKDKKDFCKSLVDFSQVIGQETTKRALEISAAGGHNIAMYGPPGTGKTMLARAFSGILPELSQEQALEITEIHSAAGVLDQKFISSPPFRSPHHTASYVSIIGGGTYPKPGEVTLAHRGVLFLDEFVEFENRVLESLREPLEDNFVNISRAKGSVKFPASFILVAALNPPSEVFRDSGVSVFEIQKFKKKLSGPIMDRIDLWSEVAKVDHKELSEKKESGEKSEVIRKRVEQARKIQEKRFGEERLNSEMSVKDINNFVILEEEEKRLLENAAIKMDFSPRVFHKIKKIARTISDLENSDKVKSKHILEALQYRPKEII
jgi:magnesium chelatase family protein